MDQIADKISEILQDPDRIKQITELAASMGLSPEENETEAPSFPIDAALEQISQLLHQAETRDNKQQTLIQALLPYLNPRRKARLEQAMRVSQLSRLAGTALQSKSPFFAGGGTQNV